MDRADVLRVVEQVFRFGWEIVALVALACC